MRTPLLCFVLAITAVPACADFEAGDSAETSADISATDPLDDPALAAELQSEPGLVDELRAVNADGDAALRDFARTHAAFLHEAWGVTLCNVDGATVHVSEITLPGSFRECQLFEIENLGRVYLRSIVGEATLSLRPRVFNVGGIGQDVEMFQLITGIHGFWDPETSSQLRVTPDGLNQAIFEHASVLGPHAGAASCPERVIDDPLPDAPDADEDGKIHGLRFCEADGWLDQRVAPPGPSSQLQARLAPVLRPFVARGREDLFLRYLDASTR